MASFTHTSLRMVYKRHGIKYLKPNYCYARKDVRREQIQEEQIKVARELAQQIKDGKHVIYLDETTFNQWQVPSKLWVSKDMQIKMPSNRGSSITVIGAISH